MILGTTIFSNTVWTFWNVFLLLFLFIPLLMLWFFAIFDVFRRHDIHGFAKALWLLAIVIFPWIGTLVYLIARPWSDDNPYAGGAYDSLYDDPYGYGRTGWYSGFGGGMYGNYYR